MTTFPVTGASCHIAFNCMKSDIQLNWTRILDYSSALQCFFYRKVSWSKKLRKIENFSFNLNIRVPLESVNLFLHVFCVEVILTMEHIKLLTIFIWKFAIFWSWQFALWNLGQLAPVSFFYLQQAYGHHVWDIYVVD